MISKSTLDKVEKAREKFISHMNLIKSEREFLAKKEIEIIDQYLSECEMHDIKNIFSRIKDRLLRKDKEEH